MKCAKVLSSDETALNKKLINRSAKKYMCISCLADYFTCSEDMLRDKIIQFRASGCVLFEKQNK